ncbi:protein croquemort-like isoform X2 [Odontomachus brunneus]|nr:protein croquemort-like isoform X2 [Odontomachus brunneus]XP_032665371.1 protein croquemort-like isoform X2 [Odontomachus brunneus]XP_032665378.1 protein croquemort-like isoform X2 [Odontomachus brunneus]XP_032665389.1 protein croquemort-like isoform X2 [Odontomachus brunneus]
MASSGTKIVIILIVGVIITIFGVLTGSFWPSIYNWTVAKVLILTPSSISYNMWKETPIPMYFKFYMFNWTNPREFIASNAKPNFVEMGPYVFREIDYKVNKVWNDNGTVTFQRRKEWYFDESLSNGSLSDKITNLNPIAATVAFSVRNKTKFMREITDKIIIALGEPLVITKSVGELLFDGYNDTLLRVAKKLNATTLPYTKFAWFYARNNSDSYDGTFNMFTGSSNLYDLGQVQEWNYNHKTSYFKDSCGTIRGTNGDLWPPLSNNSTVSIFINDICTSLNLEFENLTTFQGLTGRKYIGNDKMLDNGDKVASRRCYCPDGDCGPSGTLNISSCKFGAPAFVSMPHFYLADPSYRNAVSGMHPSQEKHELSMLIEPTTGIPLQVKAQLQLNLLLEPVEYVSMFQNLTRTYIPMLWFTQEANLTASYASMVKVVLILPSLGVVTCFGIAGIGILIFFIGIFIYIREKWRHEERQVLLSKQEDDATGRIDTW